MDSWRPKPLEEEALEDLERLESPTSATSSLSCVSLTSWQSERSTSRFTPPWKLLSSATTAPRMRTGTTEDAVSLLLRAPCGHSLHSKILTLFLPRGKVRLQEAACKGCQFLPLVRLATSKQYGHGAQYYFAPPTGAQSWQLITLL